MTKPTIDELLRASAPRDVYDEPGMRERVAAALAVRPKRKLHRAWIVLPAAALGVAALTAGAVVVDNVMTLDVPISLTYVTDTGHTYECEVLVGGSTLLDPQGTAIANWYREQDWSGFGQKVYERALEIDSAEILGDDEKYTEAELDNFAWGSALSEMIGRGVPAEILGDRSAGTGAQWDCDGLLH